MEELNGFQTKKYATKSKAILKFQPNYTEKARNILLEKIDRAKSKLRCLRYGVSTSLYFTSYDRVWKRILKDTKKDSRNNVYPGAFVAWDDAQKKKGEVFTTEQHRINLNIIFQNLLIYQAKKKSDFIFYDAWNEWAGSIFRA